MIQSAVEKPKYRFWNSFERVIVAQGRDETISEMAARNGSNGKLINHKLSHISVNYALGKTAKEQQEAPDG